MTEEKIEIEVGGLQSAKQEVEDLIKSAQSLTAEQESMLRGSIPGLAGENIRSGRFQRGVPAVEGIDQNALAQRLSGGLQNVAAFGGAGTIGSTIASGGSFSGSGLSGQLAGNAVAGGAGLVAAFNPIAGVIASAIGGVMTKFTDRFFGRLSEIENQAGQATKGRVSQFASRGIAVGDDEISTLLARERRNARRNVDAMEQVSRIQDQTSGTIEGFVGNTVRRAYDSLIG